MVKKRAHTFLTTISSFSSLTISSFSSLTISSLTSTSSLVSIVPRRAASIVCAWWRGEG